MIFNPDRQNRLISPNDTLSDMGVSVDNRLLRKVEAVEDYLANLSEYQRQNLEQFFRCSIACDGMGYGLFGARAVSLVAVTRKSEPVTAGCFTCSPRETLPTLQQWQVWQEHSIEFASSKMFMRQSNDIDRADSQSLIVVNNDLVLRIVSEHLGIFRERLDAAIKPIDILHRLQHAQGLSEAVGGHLALVGILLGYGERNALLFEEKQDLQGLKQKGRISSAGEERLSFLREQLIAARELSIQKSSLVRPLSFLVDRNDVRSQILVDCYNSYLPRIETLLKSRDFLVQTILLFQGVIPADRK